MRKKFLKSVLAAALSGAMLLSCPAMGSVSFASAEDVTEEAAETEIAEPVENQEVLSDEPEMDRTEENVVVEELKEEETESATEVYIPIGQTVEIIQQKNASARDTQKEETIDEATIAALNSEDLMDSELIEISEKNFPDPVLREYLENYNKWDEDGYISNDLTELMPSGEPDSYLYTGIKDLTGVELFPYLKIIYVPECEITNLDVSGCTALEELSCWGNNITSLDVSGCTALTTLSCSENNLTSLDISGCTALKELSCWGNNITSLDVSGCTALTTLSCSSNNLTVLDISNHNLLEELNCAGNDLTSLNASGCSSLVNLYCPANSGFSLSSLNVEGCTALTDIYCPDNQLTDLDLSDCISLTYLNCSGNQLNNLNVKNCTSLTQLWCGNNLLSSLDVSGCKSLAELQCYDNKLENLNINNCKSLTVLDCQNIYGSGKLTSLDVSGCASLIELRCGHNELSSLNIDGCTSLSELRCEYNNLSKLDVGDSTSLKELICYGNSLTSLDVSDHTSLNKIECDDNGLTNLNANNCISLTYLDCHNNKINNLKLSGCSALIELNCSDNQLETLNIGSCKALTTLQCNENSLKSLDLNNCMAIVVVSCYGNSLTSLDVSKCKTLKTLSCSSNALSKLNVTDCTSLETLDCTNNKLDNLIVNKTPALKELSCGNNNLNSLDLSKNIALQSLRCYSNNLSSLDVSKNTVLQHLDCELNALSSLDVRKNTALVGLFCNVNNLSDLDVTKNTALQSLECGYNKLSSLDVSKNISLNSLDCRSNNLSTLDVSKNIALYYLYCNNNHLSSLDVSNCIKLGWLECYGNNIKSVDISKNTNLYCFILLNSPTVHTPTKVLSGIYISWDESIGAEGYYVYRRIKGGEWQEIAKVTEEDTLSYIDDSALYGGTYEYTVRGYYYNVKGAYDEKGKSITISGSTLATPTVNTPSNEASGVKISWSSVSGAYMYRIFYKTSSSNSWIRITDTADTSYTWKAAKSGTKYTFTVRCVSSDGKNYTSNYDKTGKSITYIATPKLSGVSNVNGGVKISWGKVTGAEKYRIYYKTDTASWIKIADTTDTSYIWKGAKSGTKYTFTVRCVSSDGKNFTSSYDKTGKSITIPSSTTATLGKPAINTPTKVSNGVKVSWSKVSGATSYYVYRRTKGGSWSRIAEVKGGSTVSYTDTSVKAGTTYEYTVRAYDGKTLGDYDKNGKSITIPASTASIGKPTVNTPTKVSNGVKVSWSKVSGANSYYVYRRTKGGSWSRIAEVKGGSTVSYTDTSVKAGTTYEYTVRAYDGKTLGDYDKNGKSISIPASTTAALGKPTINTPTKVSNGVKVSWSKVSGANSYYVYRRTKGGSWSRIAEVKGGSTVSYTDTTVKTGATYDYTVRAYDGKTLGDYDKNGKSITIPASTTSIGKPTVNTPTKVSNGVKVSWSKVSGANSYYVYRRTKGGSWSRIAEVKGGSTVSYTDTTVKAGTTYEYTVRAYDGKTLGDYDKNGKSITIPASTTSIGKPTVNTPTKVSNGVKVSWSKVSGANSYYVYRRTRGGSWSRLAIVNGGSTVSYTDTSVKAGTTYEYTVRAYDGKTLGDYDKNGKSIAVTK